MSSIERALAGDVLVFDLRSQGERPPVVVERGHRTARTLLKDGPLRVTQVILAPGAEIAEHQSSGAITVQVLEGLVRFTTDGRTHDLGPGQLLSARPGVRHAVSSAGGATFLLTVAREEPPGPEPVIAPDAGRARAGNSSGQHPEAWLSGPVDGVPALLMPVAHALIQGRRDLHAAAGDLSPAELAARPGGAASVGFHLRHIAGSIDRLFTYARGEGLTPEQVAALQREKETGAPFLTALELLEALDFAVEHALRALRTTPLAELFERREVGRARRPSNVLGLLFHAAEHTQRHTGQVITTVRILRGTADRLEPSGQTGAVAAGH